MTTMQHQVPSPTPTGRAAAGGRAESDGIGHGPITFPAGLVGFPGPLAFHLVAVPGSPFERLEAVRWPQPSFHVVAAGPEWPMLDGAELAAAAAEHGLPADQLDIRLMLTIRERRAGAAVTANALAPLVIHRGRGIGFQHVARPRAIPLRFRLN